MFQPNTFKINDKEEIFSFIKRHSFGQLISIVENKPFSTHIPFLLSSNQKTLYAHIAKQNPQHLTLEGQVILITLDGAHDYISPSWYCSKGGVPTWNYQTVHIYGTCQLIHEPNEIKHIIESTTKAYEKQYDKPWVPNYNIAMLNAIVGIEITITDVQCKYKLSQNKPLDDQKSVINNLEKQGSLNLAKAMRLHLNL